MSYIPSGDNTVNEYNEFYYDSYRTLSAFYSSAYRDLRAVAGDTYTNRERQKLMREGREAVEIGKIRPIINMFSGFERENRKSPNVQGREPSDNNVADQFSDILLQTYDKNYFYQTASDAFEHHLKSGMSLLGIWMDYSHDRVNGEVKPFWKPFNAVMLSPFFTKRDLSDCDQAAMRDFLSKDQVKQMLPFVDPSIIDSLTTGVRDNKYQYLGAYRQYNSVYAARNLLTYDSYWKRTSKRVRQLVNTETGEMWDWKGEKEDEDALRLLLQQANGALEVVNNYKPTVELNIIVGNELLYKGPDPTALDDFPFVPLLAYFEPLIDSFQLRIQSVARQLVPLQRILNKRHIQINDIIESSINSGFIVTNGAVLDPAMLTQSGQNRVIVTNKGTDNNNDIKQLMPAQIPPTVLQYVQDINTAMIEVPGGNAEFMGVAEGGNTQISGRLAQVRASAGLKGNRGLFDNYEFALQKLGTLVLQAIQRNYTPEKIERMLNEEPDERFFDANLPEFDVTLKQGILTSTQQEAYYAELKEFVLMGLEGITAEDLLEIMPIQGSRKLKEKLEAKAQAREQAEQMAMEDKRRADALIQSQTDSNFALAQERRARILEDISQAKLREADAQQKQAKTLIDMLEASERLGSTKDQRLMNVMRLMQEMDDRQRQDVEENVDLENEEVAPVGQMQATPEPQV